MKKKLSFPLGNDTATMIRLFYLIGPVFFMLAISFPGFARNNLSPIICEEANSAEYYALVIMISTLAGSIVSPIVGRLGDLFGRRRLSLVCIIPYIGALVLIGFAKGPLVLGIGYALLGVFNVSLSSVTNGVVIDTFERSVATKYLAYINSANAIASMLGPKIVGLLANNMGAQKAMMSLTVLLGIAWFVILFTFPDVRHAEDVKIDWKGAALLPLTIGPICIALTVGGKQLAWTSPWMWVLFGITIVFTTIFVIVERRIEAEGKLPMVTLSLLKDKRITWALLFLFLMNSSAGVAQFLTLYCREVLKFDANGLGSLQLFAFVPAVVAPFIGIWLSKTNAFRASFTISGVVSILYGIVYILVIKPGITPFGVAVAKIPAFLIICFVMAPLYAYFGTILPAKERGLGLALISFVGSLSVSFFTAVYSMIFNIYGGDIKAAFPTMCIACITIGVARTLIAFFTTKNPPKEQAQ